MGSMMAKAMDESFKKNKEFMMETQKLTMERQIQMQNAMREKAMAMQLAGSRELFNWYASFYGIAAVGLLAGFLKGSRGAIIPLVPFTFILGYQWDYCYNTKVERIRKEAERILNEEPGLLKMPLGIPSFATIDAARIQASQATEEEK